MSDTHQPQPTEDEIRTRAKRYYEEAGGPEGRDDEFWLRAERDLREQQPAGNESRKPAPASKQKATASAGKN